MIFSNILIIVFLCYYLKYIFTIIFSIKERKKAQLKNNTLNNLRSIPIKSVDEQKKFLDTKFEKKVFKFSWNWFGTFLLNSIIYFGLFFIFYRIFIYFDILIPLWLAILLIIVCPILINRILKFFNLEKDDISVFLR